jgi:hypothetical protein
MSSLRQLQRAASAAIGAVLLFQGTPALSTMQRTFVASSGSDANACSITQPCRSFAAAVAQTMPGGEVIVLDSAGYGGVTIGKALSIVAPAGVYAGISVPSGVGITINAGTSDVVVLRGLTLTGLGGSTGIEVTSVGALHTSNLEIANFSSRGINFVAGSFNSAIPAKLFVADSVVHGSGTGIWIQPPVSTVSSGFITRSRFERNQNGVVFLGVTTGHISDSTAQGNSSLGFLADQGSNVAISDCLVHGPSFEGITVRNAKLRVARCNSDGATTAYYSIGAAARAVIVDSVGHAAGAAFRAEDGAIMTLERCTATDSSFGMLVFGSGGAEVRVSGSTVVNNGFGFDVVSGAGSLETRQNNSLRGNGTDATGNVVPFGAL